MDISYNCARKLMNEITKLITSYMTLHCTILKAYKSHDSYIHIYTFFSFYKHSTV